MGLAAAHHALQAGHEVTVFEADRVAGGMAAHFDFDGLSIERFYHFVCKADRPTFELMEELGLADRMIWRKTSMGYFIDGKHHRWGDPLALLAFPRLGLISKIRYGLHMFLSTRRTDWSRLENVNALDWFRKWQGERAYDLLWKRLFDLKFFEFADNISAAWIWTRIKRVGTSRSSIFQEELGYIDGGSQTLVDALVETIAKRGGTLKLGARVSEVTSENGRVTGLVVDGTPLAFDAVISTVPTPFVSKLVPGLSAEAKAKYDAIRNIGVVCVLLKLARPVTRHFWLNVNDDSIDIPGIVEFSNLRNLPDTIVYVPYYMPQTHPRFGRNSEGFVAEAFGYLQKLNPSLKPRDLLASKVGRLNHAQPVCEPGFLAKIPKVQTEIQGLQIADTCFYYPEDRGISESVRYGKLMAQAITDRGVWRTENR
jgi:protoporphyrinogen oxidase